MTATDAGTTPAHARSAPRRHGNMAARLRKATTDYAENPAAHANNVTVLVGQTVKRMRVGDYRIIFEETETELVVTRIAPRAEAYR
ncbi:MAG TPA: type II toxin-antitoxin system RelE/ParE family toxin [Acetobacteraceae bacterium]|nr:type II toxin-antitoxin system RelE/ParE family toxin [Acetobacteraceae bacterium]